VSTTFRSGNVSVTVPDIGAELERRMGGILSEVMAALEAEVAPILADARRQWPVGDRPKQRRRRSGESLRMDVYVDESSNQARARIISTARDESGRQYWFFIKARKLYGGSPHVAFVRRPMERASVDVELRIGRAITRALEG